MEGIDDSHILGVEAPLWSETLRTIRDIEFMLFSVPGRDGGKKHFIGQGNNAFIFPGLGFGAILAQATEITDGMVMSASQGLSDYTAERHLSAGLVYPPVGELREVAAHVAARVIGQAFHDGVARSAKVAPENALAYVHSKMWQAKYLPIVRGPSIA